MPSRRAVIGGLAGTLFGPSAGVGQTRSRTIGYLHPRTVAPDSPSISMLRPAWRAMGYGDDQVILRSAGNDPTRLPQLAAEIAARGAGVIIATGSSAIRACLASTPLPVVGIDLETDPIAAGLAASWSRPGGRVTGAFLDQPALTTKWIELMREVVPGLATVVLFWDPETTTDQLSAARAAATAQGLAHVVEEVRDLAGYDAALLRIADPERTAAVHLGTPGFSVFAVPFAQAAIRRRIAAIAALRFAADAGLLMTYGVAQSFVLKALPAADRILRGTPAGDIPIDRPERFDFIVNLKTARAIGRTVPSLLIAQADEVID